MANSILTPTAVTREALRILHQNLNFVGSINRQYDDSFAKSGAKIGTALKIRLPNEYTVRTGATIDVQDTSETSTTLTVSTQKGVDVNFTSEELTMELDDFSQRILEPAMSVLAANIEYDALSMYKDVSKEVSDVGDTLAIADVLFAGRKLTNALCPLTQRTLLLTPKGQADLVTATSSLFNDQTKVSQQYRKGLIGNNFLGFDNVMQNTLLYTHTTGSEIGPDTGANVNGATQSGANIAVNGTVTGTFKKGDIVSFQGCYDVHPETKQTLSNLKQFTITSDVATTYATLPISPAIVQSGAKQNVSTYPTNGGAVYKQESDDSTTIAGSADYEVNLAYHRDAFAFATADLVMPRGVDFAAREVMDGISMRIVRNYDINNDAFPCRIDVLYGYKTIREQLACRIGVN